MRLLLDRFFRRGSAGAAGAGAGVVAARATPGSPVQSGWSGARNVAHHYDLNGRLYSLFLDRDRQYSCAHSPTGRETLDGLLRLKLADYRTLDRRFDRIVSVGMFEHVGVPHYDAFFRVVRRCLAPDGLALLHAIRRHGPPQSTNPWIAKYIIPGSYCPALSEVLPAIERAPLIATDVEVLRLHYAETLRHWRRRFAANRDTIAALYDERFCRRFEFYLCGSELAFRREGLMIFQIQLACAVEVVPLTRDYIQAVEHREASLVS